MTVAVEWEKRAQQDRENLFLYLYQQAGARVAIAADDKLAAMVDILRDNPFAGVKAGHTDKQRRLVIPHFPFIIVYIGEKNAVTILRALHTSRKIAGQYSKSE